MKKIIDKVKEKFTNSKENLKKATAAWLIAATLTSCGGGGEDNDTQTIPNTPPQITIYDQSGQVIDPNDPNFKGLVINLWSSLVLSYQLNDIDGDNVDIKSCYLIKQASNGTPEESYLLNCDNNQIVIDLAQLSQSYNIDPTKNYFLEIVAQDDKWATSEAIIPVDINALPQIDIQPDKDLNDLWEGDSVVFTINVSDADGDEVGLTCEVNGQPVDCSNGQVALDNLQAWTYELIIRADDGKGWVSEKTIKFEVLANPTLTFEGVGNVADIQYTDTTIYVYGESASQGVTIRVNLSSGWYIEINGNIYYDGDLISIWDRSFDWATIYIYNWRWDLVDQKILDIGYI